MFTILQSDSEDSVRYSSGLVLTWGRSCKHRFLLCHLFLVALWVKALLIYTNVWNMATELGYWGDSLNLLLPICPGHTTGFVGACRSKVVIIIMPSLLFMPVHTTCHPVISVTIKICNPWKLRCWAVSPVPGIPLILTNEVAPSSFLVRGRNSIISSFPHTEPMQDRFCS